MKVAGVSIFLIIATLLAGLVGCAAGAGNDGGKSYTLTIDSTAGGIITVDNVQIPGKSMLAYDPGTVVSLIATPSAGYRFINWTGDVDTIADVNAALTTISMSDNYSITADFEAVPPIQYDLTIVSTGGGNVTTPGAGTFGYVEGEVVNLVAEADEGYRFVNWTGDTDNIANVNSASTRITINGDYSITANFEEEEMVYFADVNLEAAVRGAIGRLTGPIYPSNLERLTLLHTSNRTISNLVGLEHCLNLIQLSLEFNQISDISALANLTNMTSLDLGGNQINDISPLAKLTKLTSLSLWHDNVSDISVLANHTSLTSLNLGGDPITDFSALANLIELAWLDVHGHSVFARNDISFVASLSRLTYLHIGGNYISDISLLVNLTKLVHLNISNNVISNISPLANLTELAILELGWNQISDISPLLENEGLATGGYVDLTQNPLSSDSINIYIPQLQARGVTVHY